MARRRTTEVVIADIADRAQRREKVKPGSGYSFTLMTFRRLCYGGQTRKPHDAPDWRVTLAELQELGIMSVPAGFSSDNQDVLTVIPEALPDAAEVARIRRETTLTLDEVFLREIELWKLELKVREPYTVDVAEDAIQTAPGEEFVPEDLFV